MRFHAPQLQTALEEWRAETDAKQRAAADNVHFEERSPPARQAAFEAVAADANTWVVLRRRYADYYEDFVRTAGLEPHTFQTDFVAESLGPVDDWQPVIRIESLRGVLRHWGGSFANLQKAFSESDIPVLENFVAAWNASRDLRPHFAAYRRDVDDDVESDDWPERLRDRLGLGHYDGTPGAIPVALMQYTVADIRKAAATRGLATYLVPPTALDTDPSPWFFPAPPELTCGRSMALREVADESQLVDEFLHPRFDYRREHIIKLGEIRAPLPPQDLKALRNHHLLAVRIASGRHDFGEEMP